MAGNKNGGSWMNWIAGAGLALACAGGILVWKHQELLTAWKVHQLPLVGTVEQNSLLAALAENPEVSSGWLLYSLAQSDNPEEAGILGLALVKVSESLGVESLDQQIARAASLFKSMEPFAQTETLRWIAGALDRDSTKTLTERRLNAVRRFLDLACLSEEDTVQAAALQMAGAILKANPGAELTGTIRQLVGSGAKSDSSLVQIQAITAALNPGLDCLQDVAVCLRSPHRDVRQAAILALGPAPETIMDELLLPGLHDEDQTIVQLTETALQSRGLREDQIRLGKLMADPKPVKRLEVLDHLSATRDIDPVIWLKKMANDESPAVRAAAFRILAQEGSIDLAERLSQMEKAEPSASVKRLAGYYGEVKVLRR